MADGRDENYVYKQTLKVPIKAIAVRINPFTWISIAADGKGPACTMAEVYILPKAVAEGSLRAIFWPDISTILGQTMKMSSALLILIFISQ